MTSAAAIEDHKNVLMRVTASLMKPINFFASRLQNEGVKITGG
jgi:hypothetical protein